MNFIKLSEAIAAGKKKNPSFSAPALRRHITGDNSTIRTRRSGPGKRAHYDVHEGDFNKYLEKLNS